MTDSAHGEAPAARNQPPEFGPCDLWATDVALRDARGAAFGAPAVEIDSESALSRIWS